MFSLTKIFIAALIAFSVYLANVNQLNSYRVQMESSEQQKAITFLLYIDEVSTYLQSNPSSTGVITSYIILPTWLGKSSDISIYAQSGKGYVVMSKSPGLYGLLLEKTGGSASLGLSTNNSIVFNDGTSIPKPTQISNNKIVYIL